MALRGLLEKFSDADLRCGTIGFAAQWPMEPETAGLCGAAYGERRPERVN